MNEFAPWPEHLPRTFDMPCPLCGSYHTEFSYYQSDVEPYPFEGVLFDCRTCDYTFEVISNLYWRPITYPFVDYELSNEPKRFEMTSLFSDAKPEEFSENDAPEWLARGGIEGSTMDNRWFWEEHVITLEVGGSVKTDFRRITRIS